MSPQEVQAAMDALTEERKQLDAQLDDALHTFAEYEEGMNVRWQTADPAARQELMAERTRVEEELGIVTIVLRLDEIREQMEAFGALKVA
jgi:hypothetical protein